MPGYLITCFGAVSDMKSGKMIRYDDIKSPCDVGSLVAEGMMVTVPSECGCNYEVKGYRVLTSAGAIQPHTAPAWKDRLTVLDAAEPAALAVTRRRLADLPPRRRSAAPPAPPPWASSPRFSGSGRPPVRPRTPARLGGRRPAAGGGLPGHGSRGGGGLRLVRVARRHRPLREGGQRQGVWKFPTGSMLFAPPTICGGRVLVGGGDGRIYCLDATTGRCLWQFLAAPADRRVFWFGHLVSTWPVVPGVVPGRRGLRRGGLPEGKRHPRLRHRPQDRQGALGEGRRGRGRRSGPQAGYSNLRTRRRGRRQALAVQLPLRRSSILKSGDWKTGGRRPFRLRDRRARRQVGDPGRTAAQRNPGHLDPALGESGFAACSVEVAAASGWAIAARCCPPGTPTCRVPPKGVSGSLTAVPTAKLLDWLAAKAAGPNPGPAPKSKADDWSDIKSWATESLRPSPLRWPRTNSSWPTRAAGNA